MVEHQNAPLSPERGNRSNNQASAEAGSETSLLKTASRRKLLRAGLIGAPVAASLLSRPAAATGGGGGGHYNKHPRCTTSGYGHTVSASYVMGTSPDSMGPETCYSKSPDQWKSDCWGSNYYGGTGWHKRTKMKDVFPSCPSYVWRKDYYNNWKKIYLNNDYSMWDLLKYGNHYERKMIALCLSIKEKPNDFWVGLDQCDPLYNACENGVSYNFLGDQWDQQMARDFCDQFFNYS